MTGWFRVALVPLAFISLAGCGPAGPKTAPVTGKVTIGGQAADGLQITFNPVVAGQEAASGNIGADGTYTLFTGVNGKPGAVVGKYKVTFSDPNDMSYMDPGADPTKRGGRVPVEYTNAATSPKEVEVKDGKNTIDIELQTTAPAAPAG